jgi:ABC-type dipeptide/oligopeptide/nickel transport system permease component
MIAVMPFALGGVWGGAFITGTVFALVAAGLWLWIDPARRAEID